jgi:hypothetical protein
MDAKLSRLLSVVRTAFDPETWGWYEEYVRAGEYGLAVETVLDKAVGEDFAPPPSLLRELLDAADMMGLSTESVTRVRERLVSDG